MALSLTQTALVRVTAGQAVTNNLLRLLALSPSVSISGSVGTADLAAGAVTAAKATPGAYFYAATSGTNTYTLNPNPALAALADGVEVLGKIGVTNTAAATATLEVNSLTAKNIYHRNGTAVKPGDLVATDIVRFRYNSSRNSSAGGWDVMEVLPSALIRPATNDTTGTATTQALTSPVGNTPPLTGYYTGALLLVKVGSGLTNTGALTLNCDGLGTRSVLRPGAAPLLAGDWVAGQTYLLYDDGTQFIIVGNAGHPVGEYVETETGTATALAIAPSPAYTAYAQLKGRLIIIKPANKNTGAATLAVNAIATPPSIKYDGRNVLSGELPASRQAVIMHDGTDVQLITPPTIALAKAWARFSGTIVAKTVTNTAASLPNDELTVTLHGITAPTTLDSVQAVSVGNTGGALHAGLGANTIYYARVVDINTLTLHTSRAGALANTSRVDVTGNGTGTTTLYYVVVAASYNVAGILPPTTAGVVGTAVYDVYWEQAFSSVNYVIFGSAKAIAGSKSAVLTPDYNAGATAYATTSVRISTWEVDSIPAEFVSLENSVIAFGLQ